jgi:uncharacterized membrane protein
VRDDAGVTGWSAGSGTRHPAGSTRNLRVRIWLASAMWIPVLAANLAALLLGVSLPFLDEALAQREKLPITLSAAEQIFGALASGMTTFTGIVFSAVFVAAQIQTSAYSPRLAARLRRDRVIIAGLALPTATASYALFALVSIGRQSNRLGQDAAPAITVVVGLVLAMITFGVFVALVQRAFDSTQIGGILRDLLRRAHRVIDDVHPEPRSGASASLPSSSVMEPAVEVHHAGPPAVLAFVDRDALIRLARHTGAFVEVVPIVGQYITPGEVTMRLRGGGVEPPARLFGRVLVLARQRTIDQDPGFVLRMLVDIAIRALSQAINDPTTAVQAIDRIETVLVDLHSRRLGPTPVWDTDGKPCGLVAAPTWVDYVSLALMEIRHYGASSAQVVRRLRVLHERLLELVDVDERARVDLERRLLDEQLEVSFPDPEERAILARPDPLGLGSAP